MQRKSEKSDSESWQILPKCILGIRKTENVCLEFVADNLILYPCGAYMILHNIISNLKNYIALDHSEKVSKIHLFIERKIIMFEEKGYDHKIALHFLDMETGIKVRSILTNLSSSIIDIKFSQDGSKILIQNDAPNWQLSLWLYEKSRMISFVNVIDNRIKPKYSVNQVSFYPNDKNKVLVIGKYLFLSYSILNDTFVLDWEIAHKECLLCHVWLSSKDVVVSNDASQISFVDVDHIEYEAIYLLPTEEFPDGLVVPYKRLMLKNDKVEKIIYNKTLENGIRKDKLNVLTKSDSIKVSNHFEREKAETAKKVISDRDEYLSHKNLPVVSSLLKFSKGIICSVDRKRIYFIKKNDFIYEKFHLIELPSSDQNLDFLSKRAIELIEKIILNKSETILLCLTTWKRIYKLELTNETESFYNLHFTILESYHFDSILSLDICSRKSLLVTCGKDNVLNIWNYESEKLEYSKYYDEDLFSVAIHPYGLYVAIACFEKINYSMVYYEEIRCVKIFNIGSCVHCAFSNGGQYFAAINHNSIVIYSTVTYEEKITLKSQSGKIKHFLWSKEDEYIITCSNAGIVCLWDADTGEKIGEHVAKSMGFSTVGLFLSKPTLDSIFVLDNNNEIRELSVVLNEYQNTKKLPIKGEDLVLQSSVRSDNETKFTAFCCDMFGYLLLIGESNGRIRVIQYMQTKESAKKIEIIGHHNPITRIRFTHDNNYLLSSSTDGTVIIWNVSATFSFQDSVKIPIFNEILITKTDLQARNFDELVVATNLEQQNEIEEYDLKLKEMANSEKFKAIDYNCKLNLSAMRSLLRELKIDSEVKLKELDNKLQKLVKMFEFDLNVIQESSEKELIRKYYELDFLHKTYQELLETKDSLIKKESRTSITNETKLSEDEKEIEAYYKYKLEELEREHKIELKQLKHEIKLNEEENKQIEIEGDEEVELLKRNFEMKLKFYRRDNEQLQLENCFMRKKLIHDEGKIQELNKKRDGFSEFIEHKKKKFEELETTVNNYKSIVDASTRILVEKDERAFKIKQNSQQLEKMRFINENQIVEFQNDINPLKEENERFAENIEDTESKCNEIMNKITKLKSVEIKLEKDLSELNIDLSRMNQDFSYICALEKLIHKAIFDLQELNNEEENSLKILLSRICFKLPKFNNEIGIDQNALHEIDGQIRGLESIIKKQEIEVKKNIEANKETELINIKENLFVGNNFESTRKKRLELEEIFKKLIFDVGLKKLNANKFIHDLSLLIKIFKFDKDDAKNNNHLMQLNIIKNLVRQCNETAKILKDIFNENDTDFHLFKNIIQKYINRKNI